MCSDGCLFFDGLVNAFNASLQDFHVRNVGGELPHEGIEIRELPHRRIHVHTMMLGRGGIGP